MCRRRSRRGTKRRVDTRGDLVHGRVGRVSVGCPAPDEHCAWGCSHLGIPVPRFDSTPGRGRRARGPWLRSRERRVPEQSGNARCCAGAPDCGGGNAPRSTRLGRRARSRCPRGSSPRHTHWSSARIDARACAGALRDAAVEVAVRRFLDVAAEPGLEPRVGIGSRCPPVPARGSGVGRGGGSSRTRGRLPGVTRRRNGERRTGG